jgi:hypothetical protein
MRRSWPISRVFAYNPGIGLHIAELGHACAFLSRLRMAATSSAGE